MNMARIMVTTLCASVSVPALALPLTASAADTVATQAAQTCSRALAARMGTRLAGHSYTAAPTDPSDIFPRPNELTLTARNPSDHRVVARAICYYRGSGQVTGLTVYAPDPVMPKFMETGP